MVRYNVELKYQVTVDAVDERDAYKKAQDILELYPEEAFPSKCSKSKNKS